MTSSLAGTRAGQARVDDEAVADFARRYGQPQLGPVIVVIPAYNEAATIGSVLAGIPARVCGHQVSTLVVVDGGDDDTATLADGHGALWCATPFNRGQGAALSLGYRVAVTHGGRWIVTIDADGQWDPAQTEVLVQPLIEGEADLVLGSRRLGRDDEPDLVRNTGVLVFSALISLLTRVRVTDSSSGFRAMTAAVASTVELTEPQYQAAELLIGALGRGFRLAERPITHHVRRVGTTRKGRNVVYGYQYTRVIVRTWLRER